MSLEAMDKIRRREQEADGIIAEAKTKAKQIIAQASENAARARTDIREKIKLETQNASKKQLAQNEEIYSRERKDAEAECEDLRKLADMNMDNAVKAIMERVVNA